jgi:hypothetical protein
MARQLNFNGREICGFWGLSHKVGDKKAIKQLALEKCKPLFGYQHLLLLRDTRGLYHKTYYGHNSCFP